MRVLIVDDEPYMVDYLRKLVDWEQHGFEHVYTAGGGFKVMVQREVGELYPCT